MAWPKGKKRGPKKPQAPKPAPPTPKPAAFGSTPIVGYKILVNRLSTPFQFIYGGTAYTIEVDLLCPTAVAHHGMRRSLIKFNPVTGQHVYALGLRGETDCTPLPKELEDSKELIDRTDMPQEIDPATGQPLHQEYATIPGGLEKRSTVSAAPLDFSEYPGNAG